MRSRTESLKGACRILNSGDVDYVKVWPVYVIPCQFLLYKRLGIGEIKNTIGFIGRIEPYRASLVEAFQKTMLVFASDYCEV